MAKADPNRSAQLQAVCCNAVLSQVPSVDLSAGNSVSCFVGLSSGSDTKILVSGTGGPTIPSLDCILPCASHLSELNDFVTSDLSGQGLVPSGIADGRVSWPTWPTCVRGPRVVTVNLIFLDSITRVTLGLATVKKRSLWFVELDEPQVLPHFFLLLSRVL